MDTPRHGHPPIAMRRLLPDLADDSDWPDCQLQRTGDFFWDVRNGKRALILAVPHVCGMEGAWLWSDWTLEHPNENGAEWSWNGDEDKPTLSPSLHWVGVWHGFVRNGELVEA